MIQLLNALRTYLSKALQSRDCIIMTGSGTLANEAMILQIHALSGKGLILSNGEFGERLIRQCQRYELSFDVQQKAWGESFDITAIENVLKTQCPTWILFCHCETSSGIINPLDALSSLCKQYDVKLYADCMSTIGNIPVNLSEVAMATCSSGKGLASYPGLSIVFCNTTLSSCADYPQYLDLSFYQKQRYMPYTISSNQLLALSVSASETLQNSHYKNIYTLASYVKTILTENNCSFISDSFFSSYIFTIPMQQTSSIYIGEYLKANGIALSYESSHLIKRNGVQLAIMGHHTQEEIEKCMELLKISSAL